MEMVDPFHGSVWNGQVRIRSMRELDSGGYMSNIKDYADGLQRDVVSEMAEHYFGARKNLENMVEVVNKWADELRSREEQVIAAAGNLHALLLDAETVRSFYIALDIVPGCVPPFDDKRSVPTMDKVPFALTRRARWIKCVEAAYHRFYKAADAYLNGTYFTDEEGRKRLTIHYVRLKAMTEYVNEEVDKVNEDMAPSEALRYIKNMDPEYVAKENLVNPCLPTDGCSLDGDLKFGRLDFDSFGLMEIQELPHTVKVAPEIKAFCKSVYSGKKEEIGVVLDRIRAT